MAFKRPGVRIPLSPPQKYRTFVRYFFMWDWGFPRFYRGVALQHEPLRADADAITEASRSLPTNPLISTTKNTSRTLFGLFYFCWGGISRLCDFSKIAPRFHRANPFGLITNEERRKRVAFADIECSLIANKSDTKCPRKAQCNARFVERRRSEK